VGADETEAAALGLDAALAAALADAVADDDAVAVADDDAVCDGADECDVALLGLAAALVLAGADAVAVDDAVAVADADAVCDGVGAADGVGGAGAMKSTHARVRLAAEWDRSPPATSTVPWAMLRLLVAFASAVVLNRTSAPDASDVDSGRVTTNTPTPPAVTDAYSSVASCWASGTGGARPPVRLM
jgi:hypothetical protein